MAVRMALAARQKSWNRIQSSDSAYSICKNVYEKTNGKGIVFYTKYWEAWTAIEGEKIRFSNH